PSAMMKPGRKRRVMRFQRERYDLDEYRFNPGPPAPARFAHRSASRGRSARKTRVSVRANPPGTNPGTRFSQTTTSPSTGSPSGEIAPTERQLRGEMHAVPAPRGNRRPRRIARNIRREVLVDGDDHIGIPQQHLLDGDVGEPAARAACDVLRDELD